MTESTETKTPALITGQPETKAETEPTHEPISKEEMAVQKTRAASLRDMMTLLKEADRIRTMVKSGQMRNGHLPSIGKSGLFEPLHWVKALEDADQKEAVAMRLFDQLICDLLRATVLDDYRKLEVKLNGLVPIAIESQATLHALIAALRQGGIIQATAAGPMQVHGDRAPIGRKGRKG